MADHRRRIVSTPYSRSGIRTALRGSVGMLRTNRAFLTGSAPGPTFGSAARAGGRRWDTTGRIDPRSGNGSTRRPRTDPLLVVLVSAVTMELFASLGIAFGVQPAGSLGMIAGSVLAATASALVLRRQPNRLAARRIYVGLLGCAGVTAVVLLVSSAVNALAVGAVLAPICGIVVVVALVAGRGNDSAGKPGRIT